MSEIKNKQHYVFQAYLSHWDNNGGKVWCMDKKDSRAFLCGTDGILNKRKLYKLQELNEDERKFFILMMVVQHLPESQQKIMLDHIDEYLLPFFNKKNIDYLKANNRVAEDSPLFMEIQDYFRKLDSLVDQQIIPTMKSLDK